MEEAARNNLQIKPPRCNRKDRHPEIKALIDQRLRALQNNDYEAIKDITKLLKKTARRIRVNQQTTALKDHAWEPVDYLKKNFVARHTKLRDRLGNLVPDSKRAEAHADYVLRKIEWKPNETEEYKQIVIDTQPIYEEIENMNTGRIILDELNFAVARLKSNTAPGPDGLPSELYKWLDEENRTTLLRHLKKCCDTETLEDCMNDANLATIYEKGATDRPENYRPIALFNITYKILAIIIHVRLCESLDDKTSSAQFGFRKKKSTAQPLFIYRRLQEIRRIWLQFSHPTARLGESF